MRANAQVEIRTFALVKFVTFRGNLADFGTRRANQITSSSDLGAFGDGGLAWVIGPFSIQAAGVGKCGW
jgi:hypothetical protein